ncbi:MAG: glycosyltransferase family 2 protein [Candidatus Sericytochromatia bacterium]
MLPPTDHSAYHGPTAELREALRARDYLRALPLCQQQLEQCLSAEALIHLHVAVQGLNWPGLAARIRHLGWLCFPTRFLACAEPDLAPETEAPEWLINWFSPSKRPQVSLCMIVRNAEDTLLTSLRSAESLVDEMILIDTGSSDQTPVLAQSFSAKVVLSEIPWPDDFAAARNVSLQAAQGDWVLVLDADEILLPQSQLFLKAFFGYAPLGLNLFIIRQHQLSDRPGHNHWAQLGRIFAKKPGLVFHGPLHEQLCNTSPPWYLHPVYLPEVIVEHSGQLDVMRQKHQKQNRNALLDQALQKSEYDTPYFWFQKGHVLLYQTHPPALAEARLWLEKALEATAQAQGKLPASPTWLGAPLGLNLYYLLECLFWQRALPAMAQIGQSYSNFFALAESRALGGWSMIKSGHLNEGYDLLNGFFEPGLPAVHSHLKRYTVLVQEALLDYYLAQREGWLALCSLQALQEIQPHPGQAWIRQRLLEILGSSEEQLEPLLLRRWAESMPETQAEQWFKYAFVALSLFPQREQLPLILAQLQASGYLSVAKHLAQAASQYWQDPSFNSQVQSSRDLWQAEPPLSQLKGQWRWYQLLKSSTLTIRSAGRPRDRV